MKLTDPWFEAEFYGAATPTTHHRQGGAIAGAQGISMWCPCGHPSRGDQAKSTHGLLVPFANPQGASPAPEGHGPTPRWKMTGSGLDDLTITPSIDVGTDHCWHGFITNGEVT